MINVRDVVHETLDGEVVVVNLRNGRYYSLIDTACEIWTYLVNGLTPESILAELKDRYSDPSGDMGRKLSVFLDELTQEGLLERFSAAPFCLDALSHSDSSLPLFRDPVLTKHLDMESLLLLDPIHDVAEQGWPAVKAQS